MDTSDLADRIVGSALGLIDVLSISSGHQLGLYRALADGDQDAEGLAAAAGIHRRYAREWLEQQAASGLLELCADGAFQLPDTHRAVLVDSAALTYLGPLTDLMAAAAARLPDIAMAFQPGGGVGWSEFGPLMRTAQAAGNRPWFEGPLVDGWLPSVVDLADRHDRGAHVLEIGCGEGWASISVATRWPTTNIECGRCRRAIARARRHAAARCVTERVTFHSGDDTLARSDYDLVMALECIHDMPDPVTVLRVMRNHVAPGGTVLVMDEHTADRFDPPGDDLERLLYGWSLLICLPDSMSHAGSVATGTVMRPATLREYALAAGFSDIEILPIEHDLWRFYRLAV